MAGPAGPSLVWGCQEASMRHLVTLAVLSLAGRALAADPAAEAAQGYTLQAAATPPALAVGEAGKLSVTILPKAPTWHVHPQAPLKIRFDAPSGLKVERAELGRKDVV